MEHYAILPIVRGCINGLRIGFSFSDPEKYWIGTTGEPLQSYSFWKHGTYIGELEVPHNLQIGDRIHVGRKGDSLRDRRKWILIDMDKEFLLLERVEEGSQTDGKNRTLSDEDHGKAKGTVVGNGDEPSA